MPVLHHWDYLFAIGTIFAGLDAFMIGANDVANSFASMCYGLIGPLCLILAFSVGLIKVAHFETSLHGCRGHGVPGA